MGEACPEAYIGIGFHSMQDLQEVASCDIQCQNGPLLLESETEMEVGDEWIEWFGVVAGQELVVAGDCVWGGVCGGDRFLASVVVSGAIPRKKVGAAFLVQF